MQGVSTLVSPRAWTHGRAQLKGEFVKLEAPVEYYPYECADLLFDFTALQKPDDVVAFVSRYGLLFATEGAEKVVDILREAAAVRLLANLVIWIRNHDTKTLREIWEVSDFSTLFEAAAATDEQLLEQASALVAFAINERIQNTRHGLIPEAALEVNGVSGSPGVFLWVAFPENLLGYVYHQLAMTITHRVPLATCQECGRIFKVEHGRQQYCSTRCAGRARIRRYREKTTLADL